ncbi:MAG TPA: NAD(P)-dependent alcohol dehydrogenase [Gammaproteobacteria bacterium]|nr:NAD(P)-dependent alcohol dehydrogenase [Gammaproteobacteria bacterium]
MNRKFLNRFAGGLIQVLGILIILAGAARAADPGTMRQYQMEKAASGEGYVAVMKEALVPAPAANEVLVRIRAVSLNHKDLYAIEGSRETGKATPGLSISDGAGDVVAVGSAVTRFKAGDRVVGGFDREWVEGKHAGYRPREGLLSEYALITEQTLAHMPDSMSYEDAATLPCAGVTAWTSYFVEDDVKAGDYVLLEGTGGVSIFGLQLAAAIGAKPIITSSSDEKLEKAKALGAVATINYRNMPDWTAAVREAAGGAGVVNVLEVGGKDTLPLAIKSLAMGGHIALIGGLSEGGFERGTPEDLLKPFNARLTHIYTGSRTDLENLLAFVTEHRIQPVIDRVFPFEEAMAAYDYLEGGKFFGKIVIRVAE